MAQSRVQARFDIPDDLRVGVYANNLRVSHSPYEFTLDFAVADDQLQPIDPDDPESDLVLAHTVVSRVRLPVSLVFDIIRTINLDMTTYEATWGDIRRPEHQKPPEETE